MCRYFYQKPILVSDIKGLRTPIEKDKTGEWTSKEPKEIAANIKKMLEDNNYRRYQKKLVKVKNDYLWSSFVKKWDTFIETI